jgi:hypothetical protein
LSRSVHQFSINQIILHTCFIHKITCLIFFICCSGDPSIKKKRRPVYISESDDDVSEEARLITNSKHARAHKKIHVENLRPLRLIMYSKHVPPNPPGMTPPSHNNRAEHGKSHRKNFISYSIKYTVYYEK